MVTTAATKLLPAELEVLAERIVIALTDEAAHFAGEQGAPQITLAAANFTKVIDPGNQLPGYEGVWRNARNERCGCLTFNSDGSFYAEYDLFCPHPRDARWFVEMITAWGRADSLRVEAQMIPSP
ncbi:MAG: hypothetical protein HY016_09205 [Nitrosomonadales bacterium]|nr:hypothetical protein [Nitrosomonadales bacterium]